MADSWGKVCDLHDIIKARWHLVDNRRLQLHAGESGGAGMTCRPSPPAPLPEYRARGEITLAPIVLTVSIDRPHPDSGWRGMVIDQRRKGVRSRFSRRSKDSIHKIWRMS